MFILGSLESLTQNIRYKGSPPPTILLLRKLGWSFVWYKNLDRSFLRFVTIHAFDIRTYGQTAFSWLVRAVIPCKAEKILWPWPLTQWPWQMTISLASWGSADDSDQFHKNTSIHSEEISKKKPTHRLSDQTALCLRADIPQTVVTYNLLLVIMSTTSVSLHFKRRLMLSRNRLLPLYGSY